MKLSHFLLLSLVLGACEKKEPASQIIEKYTPRHGKMIATITHFQNGQTTTTEYYYYDKWNRPASFKMAYGSPTETNRYNEIYIYSNDMVTIRRTMDNDTLPTFYYFLKDGLASSYLQPNTRTDHRVYLPGGFLSRVSNYTVANGFIDTTVYSYDAYGNCVKMQTVTQSLYTNIIAYTFIDTANTISDENKGFRWLGTQNNKLTKYTYRITNYNGYADTVTYRYDYQFYPDGSVQSVITNQIYGASISYLTDKYTYYE